MIRTGGQPQSVHRPVQQLPAGIVEGAVALEIRDGQILVAPLLPLELAPARRRDLLPELARGPPPRLIVQFSPGYRRHFDMHIDAVEQRPGHPCPVALDLIGRAAAAILAEVAAGAWFRCIVAIPYFSIT